jgi:alkylation response protein AidB-like acyl-CoA dehydrogenase
VSQEAVEGARDFAEKVLKPGAAHWDEREALGAEALKEAGRLGFFGLTAPEEFGGLGLDALSYADSLTELARGSGAFAGCLSVHNSLAVKAVARFGTPEQKARWLPRLASGETIGAYSLSEAGAGSDAGGITTKAVLDGEHFVVDGSKCWVTSGGVAGLFILFVSTSPASGSRGISCLLLEKGLPGFSLGKKEKKMGLNASDTRQLFFDKCRVPKSALLGQLHGGFKIAMSLLEGGRIGIGAIAVGIAQAAFEESVAYAKARRQFGKPIAEQQLIQEKIARMAVGLDASRLLVRRAAALLAAGKKCGAQASMAKLFATRSANKAVYDAVQIHGGNGYVREFTVERLFRDARAAEIFEGSSEIQHLIIARAAFKDL